jgi:putative transposase
MRDRPSEWTDLRKSPPRSDDVVIKQAIANVVKDRATYGYRRVWARLRLEGHDRVNHKRVYRVMRDEGWLLYRHGDKPVDTRKHEGKVAVRKAMFAGVQMAWNCHATTARRYGWRLRWTAATGKS